MAYSIVVHFEGADFSKVDEDVNKYFREYHPCGYGTCVERTEYKHKEGKLVKIVTVSRYSSCD